MLILRYLRLDHEVSRMGRAISLPLFPCLIYSIFIFMRRSESFSSPA